MNNKIIEIDQLKIKLKTKKGKIVLVHGVFDLFHIGHLKHLKEAKKGLNHILVSLDGDKVAEVAIIKGFNGSAIKMDYRPVSLVGNFS